MGSGSLTLNAANTYTGGTTLNAGSLILANGSNGSALGSGNLTINGGTVTVSGTGSMSGTAQYGTGAYAIAPGNSLNPFGDMMVGGLSTSSATTLHFDIGSPVAGNTYGGDLITVSSTGSLSIGSSTKIALSSLPTATGDYRLLADSNNSVLTGINLSNFVVPSPSLGTIKYTLNDTSIRAIWTSWSVPPRTLPTIRFRPWPRPIR